MAITRYNQTTNYTDTGCKKAMAEGYTGPCLECPFIKCSEDSDFNWSQYEHEKITNKIKDLWDSGVAIHKIMKQYHISYYKVCKICGEQENQ